MSNFATEPIGDFLGSLMSVVNGSRYPLSYYYEQPEETP